MTLEYLMKFTLDKMVRENGGAIDGVGCSKFRRGQWEAHVDNFHKENNGDQRISTENKRGSTVSSGRGMRRGREADHEDRTLRHEQLSSERQDEEQCLADP